MGPAGQGGASEACPLGVLRPSCPGVQGRLPHANRYPQHQVSKNSTPAHSVRTLPPQVASESTGSGCSPMTALSPFQAVTCASDQAPDSNSRHKSRRSPILLPARLGSWAPSLGVHSFSRAAQGTQHLLTSSPVYSTRPCLGNSQMKRGPGRGVGRGTDFHATQEGHCPHGSRSPTQKLSGSPACGGFMEASGQS
uniref:Uncharacterized protein n=1 Tax=Myotis myotis TaxID=51298 RepID=A0A7J7YEQ9_MYOMY|nr:hypothetical protein mMyoMyo1_010935 [Myotis myotis]